MEPISTGAMFAASMALQGMVGLYNAYQAQKQGEQNQAEMERLRREWEAIAPPDLSDALEDPPDILKYKIQSLPEYSSQSYSPEKLSLEGQFNPEGYEVVKPMEQQLVEYSGTGKEANAARLAALRKYSSIAEDGYDPTLSVGLENASLKAQQDAQSRTQSILQDYARRGGLTGGVNLAAQLQASSDAMGRGAAEGKAAALAAYQNKLNALASGSSLAGQISDQDLYKNRLNSEIVNNINNKYTSNFQNMLIDRANRKNQADLFNLERQDQMSKYNTDLSNEAQWRNLTRGDQLVDKNINNKFRQNTFNMGADMSQNEARNNLIKDKNSIAQQRFGNQTFKVQGANNQALKGMEVANDASNRNAATLAALASLAGSGMNQYAYEANANKTNANNFMGPPTSAMMPEYSYNPRDERYRYSQRLKEF